MEKNKEEEKPDEGSCACGSGLWLRRRWLRLGPQELLCG